LTKIRRILKDYEESGALNALVNLHAALDDWTFLTKSGELVVFLRVTGTDAECLEPIEIDQIVRRFSSALRTFDERFRLYQYVIKRDYGPLPHGDFEHPIVREAVTNRVTTLEAKGLFRIEIYFAVVHKGSRQASHLGTRLAGWADAPINALRAALHTERKIAVLETDLDRARQELLSKAHSFAAQLRDFIKVDVLDKQQAFRFVRGLLNYAPYKTNGVNLAYDRYVDFQACGSALECHRDHLRLDDYFVQVLTLKEPPAHTYAHLLKGLQELPAQFVAATEWKRASHPAMRRRIQSKRRHFYNAKASLLNFLNSSDSSPKNMLIDDSASALVGELGACLEEMEVNGGSFGEFSLTVVLYDEDRARLRRSVAECFKAFAAMDAQLTEERYNLLNAFLAVLPANDAFNLRKMWISNTNYADLSFLFAPDAGQIRNQHLGTEYLAILESNHRTPYFFNFHHGDIAHTLMLGATGAGKSFTIAHLLTHLQKIQPFTYIFELGGSYEDLTSRFSGSYVRIGADEQGLTINPFSLPLSPENLQFQWSLVRVLAESGGYVLTGGDERELFEQIQNLYAIDAGQRRLLTLTNILPRNLRQALGKWVLGGQYGRIFDNVEDTLSFARFQTFDFEGMEKVPHVLEPLLFYVLHRAQAAIYDGALADTFKVFVIDEAWRFLRNPVIRLYVQQALKTWRKKNAGMILATQSGDDLFRSEMLPVVVESCATQIFLANPGMDQAAYREAFHLSETEAEQIAALIPKRQLLLKRANLSKILNLDLERSHHS
jgi:type IV secretion/conjugal transfer VirB4 family ATPase